MYLKSIEIHGFKSFANKIVFQFHNGITGIVGPNGSGKSNVADAVRWVLGEQRIKQLRGASMQDVIFSGTETRKPLSYAYVAITLDNSDHQLAIDYDEVTVARRIYRSGESEYLINGTPCRLKDVNELFYDTGIGKEGYSIIGQGQIDKILSGKPEERRELFDEAAGIVKFKRRKTAAQTKLENEKQNLVRVNDILSELEKQVGPLEKQSEVARVYLRKKEELKTLDINVFLLENKKLREQLSSMEEKYNLASNELNETSEKYEGIKEEYERIQQEIESLDAAIEVAREQLTDTGLMRGKLEGEINVLKEQINSAHGSENHLNNRKAALEEEIAGKEQEKQDILTDKKDTDTQVQEIAEAAAKGGHEPGRACRAAGCEPPGGLPLGAGRDHAGDRQGGGPGGSVRRHHRLPAAPGRGGGAAGGPIHCVRTPQRQRTGRSGASWLSGQDEGIPAGLGAHRLGRAGSCGPAADGPGRTEFYDVVRRRR